MLRRHSTRNKLGIRRMVPEHKRSVLGQYPVSFKNQHCTLYELIDERNAWKLVDAAGEVLMWSCEQTMILVENGMITTL